MSPPGERTLVITGASSGIGAATARAAVGAGYRVVIGARRAEALDELVGELGSERALAVQCDVAEWEDNEALVRAATDAFGGFDAVFVNAGMGTDRGFLNSDPDTWKAMVLTNVLGCALTVRATLPHLLERERGHYVITSSVAGRRWTPGSLYSATKSAVTTIGESLRAELRRGMSNDRIRVTLVEPGTVDTPFFDEPRDQQLALAPEDVADVVRYALECPPHVDINEIVVRPTRQRS